MTMIEAYGTNGPPRLRMSLNAFWPSPLDATCFPGVRTLKLAFSAKDYERLGEDDLSKMVVSLLEVLPSVTHLLLQHSEAEEDIIHRSRIVLP